MNIVCFVICEALFAASMLAYVRHLKRFPIVRDGSRDEQPVSTPTRWFRFFLPLLQGSIPVGLALEAFWWRPEGPPLWALSVGAALGLVGVVLLYASLNALGANFSRCEEPLLPYERVKSGPYRWIAHPIYLANALNILGLTVANWHPLFVTLLSALLAFYAFAIRDENRALARRFGPSVAATASGASAPGARP